jgi:hypothetical protein
VLRQLFACLHVHDLKQLLWHLDRVFITSQDASISSFLVVSQLSCYWRPAVSGLAEEALSASVDPRGPNAVLQPVDCSLSIKMHTLPGGASVVEAASVVNSVNVQLHQQQVSRSIVRGG